MGVKGLGLLITATSCDMMTLAGHKEGFFVGFSLIFSDVVALSSFCWLSEGYNKLLAKMIMWNAHSWYVLFVPVTWNFLGE